MRNIQTDLRPSENRFTEWGPFTIPWGAVLWLLLLVGFGGALSLGNVGQELRCDAPPSEQCTHSSWVFLQTTFRAGVARSTEEVHTGKNNTRWTVGVLRVRELDSEREQRVWETSPSQARQQVLQLNRRSSNSGALVLQKPSEWILVVIGALLVVGGLAAAGFILRDLGHFRLVRETASSSLLIERRFGPFVLHRREVPMPPTPLDVQARYAWDRKPERATLERGHVVVVTGDGEIPLCDRFFGGLNVHDRAARSLRELLECPPRAERIEERERARLEQLLEEVRTQRDSLRWILVMAAVPCGTLLGMLVGWTTAVVVGIPNANSEPGLFLPIGIVLVVGALVKSALWFTDRDRPIR